MEVNSSPRLLSATSECILFSFCSVDLAVPVTLPGVALTELLSSHMSSEMCN